MLGSQKLFWTGYVILSLSINMKIIVKSLRMVTVRVSTFSGINSTLNLKQNKTAT